MSLSRNIATYGDVRAILDQALALDGAVVTLPTPGKALHFRHRCRQFAKLYRDHLTARGENDGASPTIYDSVAFEIEDGSCEVSILLRATDVEIRTLDGKTSTVFTRKPEHNVPPKRLVEEVPLTEDEQALVEAVKGLNLGLRVKK